MELLSAFILTVHYPLAFFVLIFRKSINHSVTCVYRMQIEKANLSDAPEILAVQKLAFQPLADFYKKTFPPLNETLDEVKAAFETHTVLKAVQDDRIIGAVRFLAKDGTCFIGRLVVNPVFQNQGVGSKLLLQVENLCPTVGRFELFTGKQSTKSLYLYNKLGYKEFKTGKDTVDIALVYLEKLK